MNSFMRFLIVASIILTLILQSSCMVSGDIRFGVPAGKVKVKSEHKKEHHEKDDDDDHHKKKKKEKKEHNDDD